MTAYTDSLGFNKGSAAFVAPYTSRIATFETVLDFAKIAAARAAAGAAALAATDTLVIAQLPKGSLILGSGLTVVKAEGAAGTIDLGITGDATLFANDFDLNAAYGTTAGSTSQAYLTADTNVVMLINTNSIDTAKVKVSISYVDCGANLGTIPNVT